MAQEQEKRIEKVQLPPKVQPEAVEDELSDADLESVSGASLIDCGHTEALTCHPTD